MSPGGRSRIKGSRPVRAIIEPICHRKINPKAAATGAVVTSPAINARSEPSAAATSVAAATNERGIHLALIAAVRGKAQGFKTVS